MKRVAAWLRRPYVRPLLVFAVVMAVAVGGEFAIMLTLARFARGAREPTLVALADSVVLSIILAPALWLAVVRPLERHDRSRGRLLGRLFDAQEQERARLARDLHDELGQQLTAVLIGLRTVQQAGDLAQARDRANVALAAASAALDEARRIARGLRPTVLEDLGLAPAVERLCEEFRAAHGIGLTLTLDLDAGERFAPAVEMCVYRVLQESLTNIARHSNARRAEATVRRTASGLWLAVADDGEGFDAAASKTGSSFGLDGMRERVELLNGWFEVRSEPGRGAAVRAELPLEATTP